MPTWRTRSACCAFDATGQGRHTTKDTQKFPPPHECPLGEGIVRSQLTCWKGTSAMSALGQKQTCAVQKPMSALCQ